MTHDEAIQLLEGKGFTSGWVLSDDQLVLWENDENPPAPLINPNK